MQRRDLVKAVGAATGAGLLGLRPDADWKSWRVNDSRVNALLEAMGKIGRTPDGGYSRTGFSDADIEGRRYVAGLLEQAGLGVSIDAAGNLIGRRAGTSADALPIVFGSHIDSVPNGGNYDGPVGSLSAIEVATTLKERGYRNRHPLWVTVWADEEYGLTGSRGFVGEVPPEELARPGREGVVLADQIKRIGGRPEAIAAERHENGSIAAYIELHIEQGGNLERDGINIGVVEGIVGIRAFDVTIIGVANHAGTTPMDRRQNALLAAAEVVLAVERIVRSAPGRQVGTVGRLAVKPGAPNVIPGEVSLSVELRDLSMEKVDWLWEAIRDQIDQVMTKYQTTWKFNARPPHRGALADPGMKAVIAVAAKSLGLTSRVMPSGAGHDAQYLARIGPMGMIFVPSVGGISHSPKEFTRPEDVVNGANVLLHTILAVDQG